MTEPVTAAPPASRISQSEAAKPGWQRFKNFCASKCCAITTFSAAFLALSKKWRLYAITYFLVLLLGLSIITLRQRAQYSAAYDLKAGHQVNAADLNAHSIDIFRMFRPDRNPIVGKYLKTDVGHNKVIWARNLSATPPAMIEANVVQVRLSENAVVEKFRRSGSKVILTSADSTEKHEGVIIGATGKPESGESKSETKATSAEHHGPDR